MEFRDLKKQYELHKGEIDYAICSVLSSAHFINGHQVKELEEKLADYVSNNYCITCANGTDALQMALMAWGIGSGDAVFVPDFTFFSSGEVVALVGATPVFVDVYEDTYNLNPASLKRMIEKVLEEGKLCPKVIVSVDLFGQPAEYNEIRRIADQYHLYILEDGAQGFGGEIGNKKACSFGDISTTSFFPAKPLGCYGDGGAVFTDNKEWAEMIASLHVHGKGSNKYDNIRIGLNSRLDTLQAAILLEKLRFLKDELESCNHIAQEYTLRLKDYVKVPIVPVNVSSSWAQYTIRFRDTEERDKAQWALKQKGIPAAIYYSKPMHRQKAFCMCDRSDYNEFVTEKICKTCLSLPMHGYLREDEVGLICDSIAEVIEKG